MIIVVVHNFSLLLATYFSSHDSRHFDPYFNNNIISKFPVTVNNKLAIVNAYPTPTAWIIGSIQNDATALQYIYIYIYYIIILSLNIKQ